MTGSYWADWHAGYDDPESGLARRLSWVQDRLRVALDDAPPGPIQLISLCAGQGRDVLGVLPDHPRRGDVAARLVELDPHNTDVAAALAEEAGLALGVGPGQVEIVTGDASKTSQYADVVPAGVVLACGLFGNMTDEDIERVTGYCTQLCATGGTVIWTRGRGARALPHKPDTPDLVPRICAWFEARGFERLWVSDPEFSQCCAAHRFTGTPSPLEPDATMFTFTRGPRP